MRVHFLSIAVLAVVGGVGCGGQVDRDGGGTGGSTGRSSGTGARNAGTDGGSQFGETELAACEKGQPRVADEPCPWIADELCYSTKEEACACVCPPTAGSVCMSGFPSDFEPVEVSCF